jgi:hypothetical protein
MFFVLLSVKLHQKREKLMRDVLGRHHYGRTATSLTRSAGVMAAPPAGSYNGNCTSGCSPKYGTV